jgi:ubiquinone/menaquinone biosynthesis C-methylase UbiE
MQREMSSSDDAKKRAAATYNAAADFYDYKTNTFWERYGRRTIERLRLAHGERVVDVCCGSGASAIPAAQAVGPTGPVVGVDLAENLLSLARTKANHLGLANVEFQTGDLLDLPFADETFDVAVCVFGIFFVPDMESAARELRRVVRRDGRVAITTWGPRFFEPVNTAFWNSVRDVKPELYKGFNPWDRICEVEMLRSVLTAAGLKQIEVEAEHGSQPLDAPEDWWPMVMGSGYRGTLEQLSPDQREQVKKENLSFIRAENIRSIEANVLYAQAFV